MIRCPNCKRLCSNIVRKCSICGTDFFENEVANQHQMSTKHAMVQQNNESRARTNGPASNCKKIWCVLLVNTSSVMKPYEEELNEQTRVFWDTWSALLKWHEYGPAYQEWYEGDVYFSLVYFDEKATVVRQMAPIGEVTMPTVVVTDKICTDGAEEAFELAIQEIQQAESMEPDDVEGIKMMYLFSNGEIAGNYYKMVTIQSPRPIGADLCKM